MSSSSVISPRRLKANRTNAKLSTGPVSAPGKARSALNALKTGLTGRTVLLPGDDAAAYEAHLAQCLERHQPDGEEERTLVQSLADTEWRLLRIPNLESGIYAVGRLEFDDLFAAEKDEAVRRHLLDAKTLLVYQRALNNLSIQEARLRRHCEKDRQALHELQTLRQRRRSAQLDTAAHQYIQFVRDGRHGDFDPTVLGFEFSLAEIEVRALTLEPDLFAEVPAGPAAPDDGDLPATSPATRLWPVRMAARDRNRELFASTRRSSEVE